MNKYRFTKEIEAESQQQAQQQLDSLNPTDFTVEELPSQETQQDNSQHQAS
jgi:hypothetical protein